MRGVDHDVGAELAADGAGAGLERVGRTQDVADLVYRVDAFVHDRQALLGARLGALLGQAAGGASPGHELDDVLELALGEERREVVAEVAERRGVHGEAELARERLGGAVGAEAFEDFLEALAHGAVEFLGLGHGHGELFDAHDAQARVREQVHDVARAQRGLVPVVGLQHHERLLHVVAVGHVHRAAHDAGVGVQIFHPHAQHFADDLVGGPDENGGLEVLHVAGLGVAHHVAVGVAHGLPAAPLLTDAAGDLEDLANRVFALEQQEHRAVRAPRGLVGRVGFAHVV